MIHIALCDDEAQQRQITSQMLEDYIFQREIAAKVWEFGSGRELLHAMHDMTFDIRSINRTGVVMSNDRQVAVPRRSHSALQSAWADYWMDGGNRRC